MQKCLQCLAQLEQDFLPIAKLTSSARGAHRTMRVLLASYLASQSLWSVCYDIGKVCASIPPDQGPLCRGAAESGVAGDARALDLTRIECRMYGATMATLRMRQEASCNERTPCLPRSGAYPGGGCQSPRAAGPLLNGGI